jgi:8-amino-7-oxononanoate synthase
MSSKYEPPLKWLEEALESLDEEGLRRQRRVRSGPQRARAILDQRQVVQFGSNDYLGLAADRRITEAAARVSQSDGWGAGASPLISGHTWWHKELADELARFERTAAAILFPSGFAANAGTIPALVEKSDLIFADRKNHASLIDGCRLSQARVCVYRHRDVGHLESLLQSAPQARRRLIVTDSLFSMDGDIAPLVEIASLRDRYGCMLMVDEAHATGVFGEQGRGLCELLGVEDAVDIKVGTLSKALGAAGGFVCGSASLIDWLSNRARSYVFSTAHPAAAAAAAHTALGIVKAEPVRRRELLARASRLRQQLRDLGWQLGNSESQIIPLHVGTAQRAVACSERLLEQGFFIPAIRPPSVPEGECLLRLGVTYDHSSEMLERLANALAGLQSLVS